MEVTCCRGKRVAWLSGAEKSRQIRQPDGWGVVVVVWERLFSFGFVAWIADRSGLDAFGIGGGLPLMLIEAVDCTIS